jgi:outer membrane protein assembly factor BamB
MIFWVDDLTDLAVSAEGTIFFGVHYTYNLYPEMIAMNPNGTIKWRASISGDLSSAPAIAKDGTIYLGTIAHSPDMISVVGYLHAFGPGKMKKIEIIQPKPGHFYLFGRDLGMTKHGNTIVIGDIDIKLKMDNEQNITNVTYYLNRNCMYTATQPPFDWTMNKRYYQCLIYNGLRASVLAVAQFQGGCLWTYQTSGFWYIHFLNN